MASASNPVHFSVQRPRVSLLYSLTSRISTHIGLLKARSLEPKQASLAFSPLSENGKHLGIVHSGKPLTGGFGRNQPLRRRRFDESYVVAGSAAEADDVEINISDGTVNATKSLGERFPALVTGSFFFMCFVSVVHLLVGVVYCLVCWSVGLPKRAPIDKELLALLTLVAFCHALGHVMSNVSFAAVAVFFTHTIKALEPFNAAASQFVLGHQIPLSLAILGPSCYWCINGISN